MADVVTMTGSTLVRERKLPTLRLCGEPAEVESRQLVPINDCLFKLEAEMRRLMSLLGGDSSEWMDNLETLSRKVLGHD